MIDVLERIFDSKGNCVGYYMQSNGIIKKVSVQEISNNWNVLRHECRVNYIERDYESIMSKLIEIAYEKKSYSERIDNIIKILKSKSLAFKIEYDKIVINECRKDKKEAMQIASWVYKVVKNEFSGCEAVDIGVKFGENSTGYFSIITLYNNYDIVYDICGHSVVPNFTFRFNEVCSDIKDGKASDYMKENFKYYINSREKIIKDNSINLNRLEYYERQIISNKTEEWEAYNKTYIEQILRMYRNLTGGIKEEKIKLEKFLDEISNYRQSEVLSKLGITYNYYFRLV